MVLLRFYKNCIFQRIGRFYTNHLAPALASKVSHFACYNQAWVPHCSAVAAFFRNVDSAIEFWIFNHARCLVIQENPTEFPFKCDRVLLFTNFILIDQIDVVAAFQPQNTNVADVTDLKIGVQSLCEGDLMIAFIHGCQREFKCVTYGYF